jgi:hypothetical protein
MNQTDRYQTLKRQQAVLYTIIIVVGLFLHLLLWDVDFLGRLGRSFSSLAAFGNLMGTLYDWVRLYLIRGIGVWMLMLALFLLFVVLPMLARYRYIPIRPSPWLAVTVSVYFFLVMKLLNVY